MTTPITSFEDILAAMERNPALRDAMRYHVLGEEILRLPETVANLAETVADLAQSIRELRETVTAMSERQTRMEERQTRTEERQDRMEERQIRTEERQDRMEERQIRTEERQDRTEERQIRTEERQDRMESDIAELKEGQTRMESDIAELKEGQTRTESDIAELKEGQSRMESDITELKDGQARIEVRQGRMDGTLNRLIGGDYERKAARRSSRLVCQHLNLHDAVVVYAVTVPDNNTIPNLTDQAVAQGRITNDQANELENADIILFDAGAGTYAVIEVSITLDDHDVERVLNWASILAQASGAPVRVALICDHTMASSREMAADNHIPIITIR